MSHIWWQRVCLIINNKKWRWHTKKHILFYFIYFFLFITTKFIFLPVDSFIWLHFMTYFVLFFFIIAFVLYESFTFLYYSSLSKCSNVSLKVVIDVRWEFIYFKSVVYSSKLGCLWNSYFAHCKFVENCAWLDFWNVSA